MPTLRLLISATVALALWAMPQLTRAQNLTQSFSDGQRAEIESIIKN